MEKYVPDEISTAASLMGRKGGSSKSPAKQAAVRENGRKGGRPGYRPSEAQIMALIEFKRHHGRQWKKELRFAWMKAGHGVAGYSSELQQLRNDPDRPETWLDRIVIE